MMAGNGEAEAVVDGSVEAALEPDDAADPEPDADAELELEPVVELDDPPELSAVVEAPLAPDEGDGLVW